MNVTALQQNNQMEINKAPLKAGSLINSHKVTDKKYFIPSAKDLAVWSCLFILVLIKTDISGLLEPLQMLLSLFVLHLL